MESSSPSPYIFPKSISIYTVHTIFTQHEQQQPTTETYHSKFLITILTETEPRTQVEEQITFSWLPTLHVYIPMRLVVFHISCLSSFISQKTLDRLLYWLVLGIYFIYLYKFLCAKDYINLNSTLLYWLLFYINYWTDFGWLVS